MILLTGFEPFGTETSNPSWDAARLAASMLNAEGVAAEALELPVVFSAEGVTGSAGVSGSAGEVLIAAIQRLRPAVVVSAGVAAGRSMLSIERVAVNLVDARIPDNSGAQPIDVPVVATGSNAYFSTLPLKAAVLALRDAGVPVEVSMSAGTYVCNALFYELQHALAGTDVPSGFVHVPLASVMDIETMGRALALIGRVALVRRGLTEPTVSAGREE